MLHVLLIGSGSIAKTYARVFDERFENLSLDIFSRSGLGQSSPEFNGQSSKFIDYEAAARKHYDLIVIGSRTGEHVRDVLDFTQSDRVLCEKPLAPSSSDAQLLMNEDAKRLVRVSAPLRQMRSYEFFLSALENRGNPESVTVRCESDLRKWRPTRNFRDGYWATKGEGGIMRELIHEFDYAIGIFKASHPESAVLISGRSGIEAESSVDASIISKNGYRIRILLDWNRTREIRHCEAKFPEGTLRWNILGDSVEMESHGAEHNPGTRVLFRGDGDRDSTFERQVRSMLSPSIAGSTMPTIKDGIAALQLIEEIEGLAN